MVDIFISKICDLFNKNDSIIATQMKICYILDDFDKYKDTERLNRIKVLDIVKVVEK